jgi:hypothetical protein
MELVTIMLELLSVLVIVVQSYDRFDPYRCPHTRFVNTHIRCMRLGGLENFRTGGLCKGAPTVHLPF